MLAPPARREPLLAPARRASPRAPARPVARRLGVERRRRRGAGRGPIAGRADSQVEPQLLRDVATFSGQLDAEYSVELKAEIERRDRVDRSSRRGRPSRRATCSSACATTSRRRGCARPSRTATLAQDGVRPDPAAREPRRRLGGARGTARRPSSTVAKARVDLARAGPRRAPRSRAPFDGVVGARFVAPGDRITDEDRAGPDRRHRSAAALLRDQRAGRSRSRATA